MFVQLFIEVCAEIVFNYRVNNLLVILKITSFRQKKILVYNQNCLFYKHFDCRNIRTFILN